MTQQEMILTGFVFHALKPAGQICFSVKQCCSKRVDMNESLEMCSKSSKVRILDTTLRDGLLSRIREPVSIQGRKDIASVLYEQKIDIIECARFGFGDDDCQQNVLESISNSLFDLNMKERKDRTNSVVYVPTLCALSAPTQEAITRAICALTQVKRPLKTQLHTFIRPGHEIPDFFRAISTKPACFQITIADATRHPIDIICETAFALSAGTSANVIGIADTAGICTPREFSTLISRVNRTVGDVEISVHAHNDMENAVENSVVAVLSGATQVEGCIRGVGPRKGNADTLKVMKRLLSLDVGMINTISFDKFERDIDVMYAKHFIGRGDDEHGKCRRNLSCDVNDILHIENQ